MKNFLFFSLLFISAITISLNGYAQTDDFPGDALDFDGTNDYVTIPHDSIGNPASDFTIEVWTKLTAYPTNDADIISKHKNDGGNARSGYALEYNNSNGIKAIMGTSGGWKHVYGSTWNLNEWHHIAMVYNASTNLLELFDNGASQGTVTVDNPAFNTMNLYFGSSEYYTANLLSGKIDEVRYWTVARTSQEIRENMNLPLSGSETGLVSYWQCNDGNGTTLTDTVSENNGTLTNMTDDDWINSTIPFGSGYSDSETEAAGTVSFTNTGLSMDFSSQNGAEITVTRIDTLPNVEPSEPDEVFDNQYWVVNRYGNGSFNTDITFTISENLTASDESNPSNIKLYTRSSTADSNWVYLMNATSVNAVNNEATFSGITDFSQFIIARNPAVITLYQNHFDLKTNNFNSIDVGYYSTPAFTDLNGDGLLDLMVGEGTGNLNLYEQDAENSTSFTLVTNNFNSIDVGDYSSPAFTDLDGDGLLDLMVGEDDGNLNLYEQDSVNSTSFTLVADHFGSINVGYDSSPAFTDLDGDGLLDLMVGEGTGNLNLYEQDAENSTSFTLVTNNFNSIDVGDYSSPAFTDLDGDGLLDLIIGEWTGKLYHYEQDSVNSTSFTLVTDHFDSINVGYDSSPAFTDLDGDGLLDLMVGEDDGNLNHYEQQGVSSFDFGNVPKGKTSTKVYSVKVLNLKTNLNIVCPPGYKISLAENSGYVQSLSIAPTNGRISDSLYVRFEPVDTVTYSGNISHSTTDAETKNIAVSGTGVILSDNFPGNTLDFDGTDNYVMVPHSSVGNPASGFTIEAWAKLTAYPSNNADIISKHKNDEGSARSGYALEYNNSTGISAIMGTSGGWKTVEGSTWNLNEWHHIAMVYNASTNLLELFDNGASQGTVTVNNPVFNTMNLYFGSSEYFTANLLSGQIDEVRFWDAALDSVQIRENINLPLSGYESGLFSYWQCNDGSGTTLWDIVNGNDGTLTNMTDDDWINSTIPFGPGYSDSETEATGTVNFTNTGMSMNFSSQNGAKITVTRIDTLPNVEPTEPDEVFNNQYWVINRYGSGSFNTDLTFTISENLTASDESNPSNIKLYTRSSTADSNWVYLMDATSVNASNDKVTFTGITDFSQFIIARTPTVITLYQNHFDLKTNNFNSIDIGYCSTPAFTDLNGDGLLDLLIGEGTGNLNLYEQDAENSTSFTLVTNNFNSIDVGSYSTPAFTDLDGDGLLDLLVGEQNGNLNHYEQDAENSTSFTLVTNNFNSIDVGDYSTPAFTDLDGDGLLDLMVGEHDGNLNLYEQDSVNSTSFTLVTNNFNSIDVGYYSTPAFTDLDGDRLLDLMVGERDGNLNLYEQDAIGSTSFTLVTNNFNSIDVGSYSTPAFTDLDGDGLLDLMVGEDDGNLNHYEQREICPYNFGKVLTGNTIIRVYSVKTLNLKANLDIDCPSAYKVSLSENSGYVQSLSISPTNGRISDSIYVRFEPVDTVTYSGNISHSSTDAETKNIAVNGTGVGSADNFPGTALDFDGTDDYVNIPHSAIGNPAGDFTIEVWVKLTDIPSGSVDIVSKHKNDGGSSRSGYALEYNSSNGISAIMGTSNGWKKVEGSTWNLNEWHHVALVYNASTDLLELFDNGDSQGTDTVNNPVFNAIDLYFGSSDYYTSNLLSGQIDEVRLWDAALDSVQIRENMYQTLSGHESGLVSYWQCNDGSGTTLLDIVSGNDGTLTNMTDDDWVLSSAPIPFATVANGDWEQDTIWDVGQNAPINPWSRVKIKHHDTLNSNMEVIEIIVDTNAVMTISAGDTLRVTGHKP